MKKNLSPEEALHRAAALCSTAEKCRSEIADKLAQWGLSPSEATSLLEQLEEKGYIDEARYCRSFVNDKIKFDRWGRLKIAAALRQKKISENSIQAALAQIDEEDYRTLLQELLHRKRQSLGGEDNPEIRAKLMRFAASRGFEGREIVSQIGGKEERYEE
ncbi:MAG: RecX family transcriptional regulator [Porphyromonadaceae bacterium]|nr:RecX family transcriptional regulator [Porphyromonadaceae bacterium]